MYILVIDETNTSNEKNSKFLITGGLLFDSTKISNIVCGINEILDQGQFTYENELKFLTNKWPAALKSTPEKYNLIKNNVIELAFQSEAQFFVSLVHKQISKNNDIEKNVIYGGNTILYKVCGQMQNRFNDHCLVFYDKMSKNYETMLDPIFIQGLSFPQKNERSRVRDRLISFSSVNSKSSVLMPVLDIVLGSFRYAINNMEKEISVTLLHNLLPLFPKNNAKIIDYGIDFYPKNRLSYEIDYSNIQSYLAKCGIQ